MYILRHKCEKALNYTQVSCDRNFQNNERQTNHRDICDILQSCHEIYMKF